MVAEESERSAYSAPSAARQSGRAVLRHAIRTRDRLPVLLKTFAGRPHPKDIARLDNEYRITSQLDSPTVVRPIALEMKGGGATLVLEDFGGEPLETLLGKPIGIDLFLELSIAIASALAEIHRRGVVHKDIKPENILVNSASREVKITEFGIATLLPREQPLAMRPSLIEGTLAYMAPEQTGRMNRPVDSRSDLYALGVVLYRMLTGRTPFEASDPLEWIHCHVARSPPSPSSVAPALPIALSELVLKLLAKDPEQRYQSADGLKRDLERCRCEWRTRGCIAPFVLGEHDAFDRFRIPRTLYGREPELAALRGALHRVQVTGEAELVFVQGGAGVRKSSLVRELHKHVIDERGIYIEGKFEELRTVPYGAILQAVLEVVLDVLAEDPVQRAHWQAEFIKALGANAKLIVDVIPQLALVIGDQPDVPELARGDAEKRFRRVFRDFIGVFARPERPLVVFLDDLHWVDPSSLALIEEVVGHSETRNLLLIGAYRDNDVSPNHILAEAQHRLEESGKRLEVISLLPLRTAEIGALVADTIRVDPGRTRELARVLHQKTGGNPFFVIQVLKALRRENLLWFDEERQEWSWDLPRISQLSYTNNVVDLLLRKLVELPTATQELLQIAASVGSRHSLEMLALASGESEVTVLSNLWSAVREGLVVLTQDSYAFVHDRMQQAAYVQIPVAQRRSVHLCIGRRMRDQTPPETREDRLFDIASQLNLGAPLLASREERRNVAELDLLAGRKARSASAFGSALDYFTAGGALLDESDWNDCYALKYALELDCAECEWLTGNPERARDRLEDILERARTRLDGGAAAELLVAVHLTLGTIGKDIEVALSALRSLGIDVSPHPSWDDVVAEYEMVESRIAAAGSIEGLVDLPAMTDPESQLAMRLLSILFGPALWSDSNLFAYHLCKMVRLSLEKGNTGASVHGYGWFGIIVGHVFHRYDDAYRWAKVGYALMARAHPAMRSKAEFFMEIISIWTQSLDTVIEHARAAVYAGLDMGDIPVASWCRTHVVSYRLLRGDSLQDVEREAVTCLEVIRKRGVLDSVYVVLDSLRYIRALHGTVPPADADESPVPASDGWLSARAPTMVCWHYGIDLMTGFMFGDYEAARDAGAKCEKLLWASLGHVQVYDFHLYYALTLAALRDRLPEAERPDVQRKIESLHAQIVEWSTHNPSTFASGAALVEAELARLRGAPIDAARGYDRAAQFARSRGFVQLEALAHELAAHFYREQGIAGVAEEQLREARDCYVRWGADGKVAQLESAHPQLRKRQLGPLTTTVDIPVAQIDLLAVAKASQTISKEIVWDKVTEALLDVVLEQSGAQRGCLLVRREGALLIELEASPTDRGVKVSRPALPATDSRHIPASVVAYAWKTKAPVILDDAAQPTRFGRDPYFVGSGARSILCVPLLLHGEATGLVYLENSLVAGAFTQDQLMVLELLAAQAAISLRNAQLLAEESGARSRAEEAERFSAFLAQAGALLNESLDYDSVISRLARLVVGALADFCSIQLLEHGELRRAGFAHAAPEMAEVLAEILAKYPLRIDSLLPGITAIRTGAIQVHTKLSDEELRQLCHDAEQARLLREIGMRNVLAVPLVARGKTLGSIALVRSSLFRVWTPAEIELAKDLAHRAALAVDNARLHRETQEAVRLRDEFLAVASHELNTPMTSLVLTLQALVQNEIELAPERRHALAKVAERQSSRLTGLIRELLDVTRLERTRIELAPEKFDLGDLLREGVARFAPELEKARCTVSILATEHVVGVWDRSRLEQVVSNLFANAIKFGAGKPIEVVIGVRDEMAYFEVADHGIGIAEAAQARIFERFERAVSVRHYGGLGLGLYICRRIVEAHGGSIRVRSAAGEGATFIVELPPVTNVANDSSRT